MHSQVRLQNAGLSKPLPTELADVRPLSCVFPHVNLERFLLCEPSVTLAAGPGLHTRVGLDVSLQITLRGELGLAEITVVGPVPGMPPPVDHQVSLAGEPGIAVLLLALEGLGVLPPVTGQTGRSGAGLLTDLTLVHSLHRPVTLRDRHFVRGLVNWKRILIHSYGGH